MPREGTANQRKQVNMAKRYKNVAAMVQGMDLPDDQKKRQTEYLHARRLSRMLTVMRAQKGLSQTQAADKLGWSQGRVSKLEKKADRDISVGDLLDYVKVLDMQMSMSFLPENAKIVDQVKFHAGEMYKLLQQLVKLCKDDEAMAKGVDQFHDQCLVNLIGMVGSSKLSLRPAAKKEFMVIGPPVAEPKAEGKNKLTVPA